jgi:pyoverdine/dityrosine biosynthesis protein Dit1
MGCATLLGQSQTIDEQILALVYAHTNSYTPDLEPLSHADNLLKVQRFVLREEPVHFVLPAFPAKSPNRRKTLGPLPDLADLEGLRTLENLAARIRAVYSPGARILICSDGRVFADVVQVSDLDVENYKHGIERMIAWHGLSSLGTFHLENVFGSMSFRAMRERLVGEFAEPLEDLRSRLPEDPSLRLMFNGIHRFLFEDQVALTPEMSREKARTRSKLAAYECIRRSNAWSRLVESEFRESLRLSIHPQLPSSSKLGIQLVPSANRWATPWHNVLVTDGVRKRLMKREEAEMLGASLMRSPEGYAFFFKSELEVHGAL